MTCQEVYERIRALLKQAGCDSPEFDARCLMEDIGGVPRGALLRMAEQLTPHEQAVWQAALRRAEGEPLQYILGRWEFLSLTLKVGDGVLVPRPDTEVLCEVTADWLRQSGRTAPQVLDLCAGSGCVGLGIASLYAEAAVTCVELSEKAWPYLQENAAYYRELRVQTVKADVLCDYDRFAAVDVIVANPPYIPSAEIAGLAAEVQHEPRMALDGDADGMRFYRVIASQWTKKLKSGGFMAVEVGIGQAEAVAALLDVAGLQHIGIFKDYGGVPRVVCGEKPTDI